MANLPVPVPRTFTVSEIETGAYLNSLRDALLFLLNKPAAILTQAVAQTLATGVAAAVTYTASVVDTYGGHSNTVNTSRYVAQVPGYYRVRGNALFVGNAAGSRLAQIYKNGAGLATSFDVFLAAGGGFAAMGIETSTDVFLNAGDYVEMFVAQDTGGNLNTYVAAVSSNLQIWWDHV